MLFAGNTFLFVFLPLVLAIYYGPLRKRRRAQNLFLCGSSLLFYAWGEPRFVWGMIASITVNWLFALAIDRSRPTRWAKRLLFLAISLNLALLFTFKYLNFAVNNVNRLFGSEFVVREIALPIGISFFTFQALSYVVDVYRGRGAAQRSILNVALYISFFPQLIAGPIVRYETIAEQIEGRKETWEEFAEGVSRLIIGLAKKVILANSMAIVADQSFLVVSQGTWLGESLTLPTSMAWLGAIAFALQIFFDFSGYSDMAIGLGRMFGFRFLENFNYPYASRSVTEYWRRWNISLGTWFRDYLYVPLGGNRVSPSRHIANLLLIWLCTGLWHGARWTFVSWGFLYFVLLLIEKYSGFLSLPDTRRVRLGKHLYILFFVLLSSVLFRAGSLTEAVQYIGRMFAFEDGQNGITLFYLREYGLLMLLGMLFSVPIVPRIRERLQNRTGRMPYELAYAALLSGLFLLSVSYIVKGSYAPFIYFNF